MRVEARAPARVDLAGGTVDIWPLYLFHPGVQTVNIAIRCYASCIIDTRADRRIVLASQDQGLWEVMKSHIDNDERVRKNFDQITTIASQMREALLARD